MTKNEQLINHLKSTGFVYPSSEIYNGLANAWDYGPLGVLLKNNIKMLWWKHFVIKDEKVVGLDSSILLNPLVWKASGHLDTFSDPLVDCKKCKMRYRADKLIEEQNLGIIVSEKMDNNLFQKIVQEHNIKCPNCHTTNFTDIRSFNLMFKTYQGVLEDTSSTLYLRPETAQGIFVNFKNVQRTSRIKLPFGIGQIGKSFRNEITPGNFIFRTREFEQMELEYFVNPKNDNELMDNLLEKIKFFLFNICKMEKNNIVFYQQTKEELAHYAKKTIDIQYRFYHGLSELWGIANRSDYDLIQHANLSKKDLMYTDPYSNESFYPFIIEPSVGVERLFYALCIEHFKVEKISEEDERIVMSFPFELSPIKMVVLPLSNKLSDQCHEKYLELVNTFDFKILFDEAGSIGKRYRRYDAIGCNYCLTFDFDSINDHKLTLRNRDTMEQQRLTIEEIKAYINAITSI